MSNPFSHQLWGYNPNGNPPHPGYGYGYAGYYGGSPNYGYNTLGESRSGWPGYTTAQSYNITAQRWPTGNNSGPYWNMILGTPL